MMRAGALRPTALLPMFALPFLSSTLLAQDGAIVTDRPDFTESAVVVPLGSVQFESGVTWEEHEDIRTIAGPELLVRWGVTRRAELRVGVPDHVDLRGLEAFSGLADFSGRTDGSLGTKIQFGPAGAWDLATIVSVSVPVGDDELTSDEWDPEVILVGGRDLAPSWTMGGQLIADWSPEEGQRDLEWGGTLGVGRTLGSSGKTSSFLEVASTWPETGVSPVTLHHGYAHRLTPRFQLDLHGGAGLSRTAPDFFLGAGFSARP